MRQLVPDKNTLEKWQAEGLTHAQMADRVLQETGQKITRSTISMAMARYGLTDSHQPRYREQLPWRVQVRHIKAYPARMLRLLGRREAGEQMGAEANARLDRWLATLEENNAVVAYDPDSEQGFLYVAREPGDPIVPPIRRQRVYLNPPT